MNLSKSDLQAIRSIVEEVVEDAQQQTAAGFAEVHDKFADVQEQLDGIKTTVNRIELQQREHATRLDDHGGRLDSVERKLKLKAA